MVMHLHGNDSMSRNFTRGVFHWKLLINHTPGKHDRSTINQEIRENYLIDSPVASISMGGAMSFIKRVLTSFNPPFSPPPPGVHPLKFGILSTAEISIHALILPGRNHPEVEVYSIAGRSKEKVESFARKHGIKKVYSGPDGYQALIDDPEVNAIYIPLPNSLHYEWSIKALSAGKHVLVEKPIATRAEEALKMHELSEQKGLILLEAMHIRYHPAIQRVRGIIKSGELGALKHISSNFILPKGVTAAYKPSDFDLAKGAILDIGCYNLEVTRFLSASNPISVLSATHAELIGNLDKNSSVMLTLPNDTSAAFTCDISASPSWGFIPNFDFSMVVDLEGGNIKLNQYLVAHLYHAITVTKSTGERRVERGFRFPEDGQLEPGPSRGEDWWTTYRHQLEAFVDKVKGREPRTWYSKADSVAEAEWLHKIYETMGLEVRPPSGYYSEDV